MLTNRTDSVWCPKCGAAPGQHCRTPRNVERTHYPHKARQKAHLAARAALPASREKGEK